MRICIYEDSQSVWLDPIALTRPAFALWCGAERLFERLIRQFAPSEIGFWMRPELVELWKLDRPSEPVNDVAWAREKPTVWINGRWLAAPDVAIDAANPHVGMMNGQIAYVVLPSGESPIGEAIDAWLGVWKARLPARAVSGALVNYLWDAVDHNATALKQDGGWFRALHGARPTTRNVSVTGPQEQVIIANGATIDPFVFADTRGGPVMIDRDAVVHSFSRLEGPCYVGVDSWVVGAKLRAGSTIGPCSRVGGEIEASIVQGFSNKYHEGFLGHSYLGEWVNLAAATQTSDLRNDYDHVKVTVNGERLSTGKSKVGAFIGDHTKTGLASLLNTGSTVGAFANVLPAGTLSPQVIPSFCQAQQGELRELWDLRKVFGTAARVMQRRGKNLT
jgi:UDP-N-acetylglucosamine diphosphorylase / glucose-1-phosphate thymidylyltransferase / UDP-N-acetylgalactosamine diphosphorylase / glucosamine-1-phosphate N-acetyltransferase / galactosamine-1-phosphate N-acetyltransferase